VTPDLAVFAKGMSNGYPVAAIIGQPKYMSAAQDTFIISTYWTERIGPAAALDTIKKTSQQLLGVGYLATTAVYMTYAHTPALLRGHESAVVEVFSEMSRALEESPDGAAKRLRGPDCSYRLQSPRVSPPFEEFSVLGNPG
jgi:hypothetical protein